MDFFVQTLVLLVRNLKPVGQLGPYNAISRESWVGELFYLFISSIYLFFEGVGS